MGDLSKNFSRSEFACRCCGKVKTNRKLIEGLQELRDLSGKPIIVNCGYRCPEHNKAVGGVKRSQHLFGNAADIVIKGLDPIQMYHLANRINFFCNGGIGIYPESGFIHVDVRNGRARWAYLNGKQVSIEEVLPEKGGKTDAGI